MHPKEPLSLQDEISHLEDYLHLKYNPKTKLSTFVDKLHRLNRTLGYSDQVLRDRFMTAMPSKRFDYEIEQTEVFKNYVIHLWLDN